MYSDCIYSLSPSLSLSLSLPPSLSPSLPLSLSLSLLHTHTHSQYSSPLAEVALELIIHTFINPRRACAGGLLYLLCLSVCLSVTTLAAASFSSTIKLRYEGIQLSILFIFNSWIFKKMLPSKVMASLILLTVTISDGIAATPVSFFPTEEGSGVVKRLTGR